MSNNALGASRWLFRSQLRKTPGCQQIWHFGKMLDSLWVLQHCLDKFLAFNWSWDLFALKFFLKTESKSNERCNLLLKMRSLLFTSVWWKRKKHFLRLFDQKVQLFSFIPKRRSICCHQLWRHFPLSLALLPSIFHVLLDLLLHAVFHQTFWVCHFLLSASRHVCEPHDPTPTIVLPFHAFVERRCRRSTRCQVRSDLWSPPRGCSALDIPQASESCVPRLAQPSPFWLDSFLAPSSPALKWQKTKDKIRRKNEFIQILLKNVKERRKGELRMWGSEMDCFHQFKKSLQKSFATNLSSSLFHLLKVSFDTSYPPFGSFLFFCFVARKNASTWKLKTCVVKEKSKSLSQQMHNLSASVDRCCNTHVCTVKSSRALDSKCFLSMFWRTEWLMCLWGVKDI